MVTFIPYSMNAETIDYFEINNKKLIWPLEIIVSNKIANSQNELACLTRPIFHKVDSIIPV